METLIHLKAYLKSDGILKIYVPTANDIVMRLKLMDWTSPKGTRNSLNPVATLEYINCYRRSRLIKMEELAGMEKVTIPMKIQYKYTSN